jgi:hypothetical protein
MAVKKKIKKRNKNINQPHYLKEDLEPKDEILMLKSIFQNKSEK